MKTVVFTLKRTDNSLVELEYQPFDNLHSSQWLSAVEQFCLSKIPLTDTERVYNFVENQTPILLEQVNQIIEQLNIREQLTIPLITLENAQHQINQAHVYFAERSQAHDAEWSRLNELLHGLEIAVRGNIRQIYTCLPDQTIQPLDSSSYRSFTIKKTWGYCYANYPHVGRHLLELFTAQDQHAHDEQVIPQCGITGSSYLYFGRTTHWWRQIYRWRRIRRWFRREKIEDTIGLPWGDPKLALGWLPVAHLITEINKQDLSGLVRLVDIKIKEK